MASKLVPNDPRVRYETADVRGKKYTYILGEPDCSPIDTIFLIHGFPDIAFGWRYQIPFLVELGYRVVAPNMVGYAGTDAPQEVSAYTLKSVSEDVKELAKQIVGEGQIILGGHDWGGGLVWRTALWFPELIKAVFSVCTPYNVPAAQWIALEDLIAMGKLTNFTYQLQFAGPHVEANIQGREKIREFLNGMYGGFGSGGEVGFNTKDGVLFDNLPKLKQSKLISAEELDHYADEYARQQAPELRGPLNWYRMRRLTWEEEQPLAKEPPVLNMPALFIAATKDTALPPEMSAGMEKSFKQLTRGEVDASHWALWQASDAVNDSISKWLKENVNTSAKASL